MRLLYVTILQAYDSNHCTYISAFKGDFAALELAYGEIRTQFAVRTEILRMPQKGSQNADGNVVDHSLLVRRLIRI